MNIKSFYQGGLTDFEKIQLPHTFRWLDHVQHLPGFLDQVQSRGLFVAFPDEKAEAPSKKEMKKAKKGGDQHPGAAHRGGHGEKQDSDARQHKATQQKA